MRSRKRYFENRRSEGITYQIVRVPLKSAGISLTRAMRSVFVISILLGGLAFYVANTVVPYAEFKTYNLRKNLAKIKPALAISEGVFNDLGQSNIKVQDKYGPNDRFLTDVIIHQKQADLKNSVVVNCMSAPVLVFPFTRETAPTWIT